MGLDITVHTNIKKLTKEEVRDRFWSEDEDDLDYDAMYDSGVHETSCYAGFERSLRGLEQGGFVQSSESWGFRAGSYGGYNHWRADLASMAGLGVIENIWADPSRHEGDPFFELVNFADNEGTIGPEACADLAKDFADHEADARLYWINDEYSLAKYLEWKQAFEDAANTGMVDFH